MYARKSANINKQDRENPASDDENCNDRREETRINMRSAPFRKGSPHTTTKRNTSSITSTSGRKLAPSQQTDTSRVHTNKATPKEVSSGAMHDNDGGCVFNMIDTTRKVLSPLGTGSRPPAKRSRQDTGEVDQRGGMSQIILM